MTLRYFLCASVLLHAAVLAAWPARPPAPVGGDTALRVALVDVQDPSPTSRVAAPVHDTHGKQQRAVSHDEDSGPRDEHRRHPSVRGPVHTVSYQSARAADAAQQTSSPTSDPRQADHAPAVQAPPVRTAMASPPATRETDSAHVREGEVVSRLRDTLHRRIHARFEYPLIARIKGWEGLVTLGLRVEPDGTLTHLRVIATSGYPILDQASLRTLRGIARVPPAADWLRGRHVDLVLPVEYRLTEGG
jgi:protein TonB